MFRDDIREPHQKWEDHGISVQTQIFYLHQDNYIHIIYIYVCMYVCMYISADPGWRKGERAREYI